MPCFLYISFAQTRQMPGKDFKYILKVAEMKTNEILHEPDYSCLNCTTWAKVLSITSSPPMDDSPILGSNCSSVVGRCTSNSQQLRQDPFWIHSRPGPRCALQCGRQEWNRSSGFPSVQGLLQETGRAFVELPWQSQIPPLDNVNRSKTLKQIYLRFVGLTVIGFPRRAAVAPVTAITPSPLAVIFGPTC